MKNNKIKILKQKNSDYFIDLNIQSNVNVYKEKNILFVNTQEIIQKGIEKADRFFVYGFITSYIINCHNLDIKIYDLKSNLLLNTKSYLFSNEYFKVKTIFNTYKAYYFFELKNYYDKEIIMKIFYNNQNIFTEKIKLKPFDETTEEYDNIFSDNFIYFDENMELKQNESKYYFFGDILYVNKNLFIKSFEKIWIGGEKEYIITNKIIVKERLYEREALGMFYTGYSRFINLKEVFKYTLSPTGNYKENNPGDPDYIGEFYDETAPKNKEFRFNFELIYQPFKDNLIYNSNTLTNTSFNEIILSNLLGNCKIIEKELVFFDINQNFYQNPNWNIKNIKINDNDIETPYNTEISSDLNLKIFLEEKSNLKLKIQTNYENTLTSFFHLSPPKHNTFKEKGKKTLRKNEIFIVSIKPELINLFDIINFNLHNIELISKENISVNTPLVLPHPIYKNNFELEDIALTKQFNNKRLVLKILNDNAILQINLKII